MTKTMPKYLGYTPEFLFSDYLENRLWTDIPHFASTTKFNDDVVILAAGPSLPAEPMWIHSGFPIIGLNRAADIHRLDYWIATSDMLAADTSILETLLGRLQETTKIILCNYAVEPSCNEVRRENVKSAARIISNYPNVLVLYHAIGIKSYKRINDYEKALTAGYVFGHRSVLAGAIEICRLLGARRIHLFGHDARVVGGKRYCSDIAQYALSDRKFDESLKRMLSGLAFAQEHIWKNKINVFNYCTASNNTVFKSIAVSEFPA